MRHTESKTHQEGASVSMSPAEVVRKFYAAVAAADGTALRTLVEEAFAEDAAISWPEGLPYGGRVVGSAVLQKIFAGMASSAVPAGPANLEVVSVVDGGDMVAAELTFDWHAPGSQASIPSGALER